MDPFERSQRRREAQRRLWARRQRIGQLRGRVVAGSLIGFVLLWGVVFTQMATGNDPVLGGGHPVATRESDGRSDRRRASEASAAAEEAIETTDPEEAEVEEEQAQVVPSVEPEPEPEFAPEPEPEPEIEFFEPEPVETTQS